MPFRRLLPDEVVKSTNNRHAGPELEDSGEASATVMSDVDVVAALSQLLGNQGRSLPVVFDAEDFFARFRHWRFWSGGRRRAGCSKV
jgi:hypothetical protein